MAVTLIGVTPGAVAKSATTLPAARQSMGDDAGEIREIGF